MIEACTSGKVRFANEHDAKAELRRIRRDKRRASKRRGLTDCYPCWRCGGWHLTSKPEGRKWKPPR